MVRKIKPMSIKRKIFNILVVFAILFIHIIATTPVFASNLNVKFDVINVSPSQVTIRAELTGYTGQNIQVRLDDTSLPISRIKNIKVEQVVKTLTEKDVPIYGKVPLTLDEIKSYELLGEKIPKDAIKQIGTKKVNVEVETKNTLRTFGNYQLLPMVLQAPANTTILDIVVNTGVNKYNNGYGSKGTLVLVIDGREYYDKTNSSWWNVSWTERKVLSFLASSISENLTNFTVMVHLDNTNFNFTEAQASGQDIRFIDSDDITALDYEIELWDNVGEEAIIWVEVPQINLGTTYTDYIYMYWGNPVVADGQNVAGTWSNGYAAVYHMNDLTVATIKDSTGVNNGNKLADNQPIVTTSGYIGNAQDFDGIDDYIGITDDVTLDLIGNLTLEAWVYQDAQNERDGIIAKGTVSNVFAGVPYMLATELGGLWQTSISNGVGYEADDIAQDLTAWRYLTGVASATQIIQYKNGVSSGSPTVRTINPNANAQQLILGAWIGRAAFWNGKIDEARVSNVARSAEWVEAQYLSMTDSLIYFGGLSPEPTVTTIAPINYYMDFNGTNAVLRGSLDDLGGAISASVWFEWGYDTGYGNTAGLQTGILAPANFTHNLTGYNPEQVIHYRIASSNVNGIGYGSDMTFKTTPTASFSLNGILPLVFVALMLFIIVVILISTEANPLLAIIVAAIVLYMGWAFLQGIVQGLSVLW